jgi:DnaJ-class molecular chaperone
MPQPTHALGHVCAHCDGFPVVAITTGTRNTDGTRATIDATCPTCKGTGIAPVRRPAVLAGR